jgi:transglutaminase-like putative cysteine protease
MAASACWYLVAVVREREGDGEVLVASLDTGLDPGDRSASYRAGAVILRMSVLAALAAALIGPNLPGARSVALVAWRGDASATATTAVPTGSSYPRRLQISTLVEVGQEEVDDPSVALFKVHSSMPTKELIATLDEFNGNSWSASPSGAKAAPGTLSSSLSADENQPPPAIPHGLGHAILVQVFEVDGLGGELAGPAGYDIPAWGYPVAVAGAGQVSRGGPGGSIVSGSEPREGTVYGVSSIVGDASPAQLQVADTDTSDPVYLKLPAPVPPRLVRLADSLVVGATSPYQKALHLEAYLTSSRFRYHLPARAPSGSVAPSRGYGNLLSFLFDSRTGYCQQFATAFAVLARIDGLPTRIAVGFLPGNPVGHDAWQVDGKDTHAWPQVLFDDYGWIDFEPTPGAGGSSSPVVSASPTTSRPVTPTTSGGGVHPTNTSPTAAGTRPKSSRAGRRGGSSLPPAPWLLVLVLAVLAWAAVVPLWRRVRLGRPSADPRVRTLAAWGEASRTLDLAGLRSRRGETYLELSQRAVRTGVLSDQAALALADLAQLVTAACYGASPPAADGARRASEDAKTVVRSARASVARWQRIAAALDPRSLPA